jgi:hypothetical protein
MSTASTIADYIRHNRSLGKRFVAEAAILSAFSRSVGKMPLLDIRPTMITRFVNREGRSDETSVEDKQQRSRSPRSTALWLASSDTRSLVAA